jgi:AbrB family looped-hinge helix DNA binding protein
MPFDRYASFRQDFAIRQIEEDDMTTLKARINEDGRVLIPAAMRKALNLRAGQTVILHAEADGIRLTTTQRALRQAQQALRRYVREGTPLVEDLLAERRRETKREP